MHDQWFGVRLRAQPESHDTLCALHDLKRGCASALAGAKTNIADAIIIAPTTINTFLRNMMTSPFLEMGDTQPHRSHCTHFIE